MSFVGRGQQARLGFDPGSVGGLILWLDAADSNTITMSGSNVASWFDKSKNGYTMNTAPTGCALPILGSNLNGLSTVGINTTSTAIKQSTVIPTFTNAFWVRKERDGNQGNQFYFGADGTYDFHTGDSGQFAHSGFSPQGVRDASLSMFRSTGVTTGTLATTTMPSAGQINLVSISNMTGDARLQGLSYDRGNTGRSATCDWGEVLLYNSVLTRPQIESVEGYLAWKWGITSYLPVTHPYQYRPPSFRSFSPLDIGGLSLWLDAADSNSLTLSGNSVTAWRDKSGRTTLSLFGTSPTYVSNQVRFNSSGRFRGAYAMATQTTVFAVYSTSNTTTNARLITVDGTNGYGNIHAPAPLAGGGLADLFLWTGGSYPGNEWYTTLSPQTGRRMYAIAFNGANSLVWRNGSAASMGGTPANAIADGSNLAVGADLDGQGPFNGDLAELILFSALLSTGDRQRVENYLAQKWGLQSSLPATHPIKLYRALSVPWTPLQIPSCGLWLDGLDATTLTFSGSNITQWSDKSGLSKHATQATPSNGPTYVNDGGYPSVRFTKAESQVLAGPGTFTSVRYGVFVVYRGASVADGQTVFFDYKRQSPTAGASAFSHYLVAGLRTSRTVYVETPATFKDAAYTSFTTSRVLWGHVDSPENPFSNNFYLTGTVLGQTNYNGGGSNIATDEFGYTLSRSGSFFDGFICEVLVYLTEPTTEQRQQIEGYLAARWGLQADLPSNHPYKTSSP